MSRCPPTISPPPYLFELLAGVLCAALLSWATLVHSPAQARVGSTGHETLTYHDPQQGGATPLEPGERRDADDGPMPDGVGTAN